MDRIEGDISVVKGGHARSRRVAAAPDIADDLNLEYVRTLSRVELVTISRALTDSDITTGDQRSFRDADLIIEAANGSRLDHNILSNVGNCSDLWGSTGHQASHRGAAKHGICFASRLVPSNVNSYQR